MLRLLYRLIVQRAKEYQSRRSALKQNQSNRQRTSPKPTRLRWILAAVISAAGLISLFMVYQSQLELPLFETDPHRAQLNIQIDSVTTHPKVIYLENWPPPLSPVPENTNVSNITIQNTQFIPTFQVVSAGSTVEIANRDAILHNTHVTSGDDTVFNVATPLKSITVRKTLTATGILDVRCDLHPNMYSWIFVPPTPHFAVVRSPGDVSWTNIVPGDYRILIWETGKMKRVIPIHLSAAENRTIDNL